MERKCTLALPFLKSAGWCFKPWKSQTNVFLPERFESEKTSPQHNGKLAAGCDHFPHSQKASALFNIVRVCVPSGVKGITFSRGPGQRREVRPRQRNFSAFPVRWEQVQRKS